MLPRRYLRNGEFISDPRSDEEEPPLADPHFLALFQGVKELARRYRFSEAEAGRFMAKFTQTFPHVKAWAAKVKKAVHEDGFVTTITERQRQVTITLIRFTSTFVFQSSTFALFVRRCLGRL